MLKKFTAVIAVLALSATANAQDGGLERSQIDEILRTLAILSVFTLLAVFIITIIRSILDYRLKNKIMDKGISESLAVEFLRPVKKTEKTSIVRWVCLLCGLGTGLSLITYFQPYGVHSFAIMIFSIAAGLLGFFFYLKQTGE